MEGHDHSSPKEPPPVVPGQVLAGKFRVERVIGEGGMGIVAEATHMQLDERVALKFLKREVMKLPDVVARFDREARAAVKLKSEHVARVSDVGKTDDGIPYMVMELLEGKDLAQILTEKGPLPISDAVEYVIQACEGVGEAHARGIVHRDLKPENLFVVQRGGGWPVVKVLDFGISKAVLVGPSSVDMQSSNTTSIMGSPYYMSPEQLRSTRSVDHRADVWSLGIVLFELLTGTTAFDETKEFTELVADILEVPHRKLGMYRPDAPPALESVIDRCLEKDRTKRYQNVAEVAVALLPFAPKRSRITAERTTAVTRAAGLITDPHFQVPPSNYPPAPTPSESYPQARMTPPGMPGEFNAMSDTMMPPRLPTPVHPGAPPQSSPSLPAGSVEATAPRKKIPAAFIAIGAVAALGVGSGFAYLANRALRPTATSVAVAPTVAPVEAHSAATTTAPTASATATATASDTATTVASAPTHSTSHTHIATHTHPTATATANTTATTAATHPTLDIQLTR